MLEVMLRKMLYGEDYRDESEGKEGEDIGMICALLGGYERETYVCYGNLGDV